MRWTCVCIVVLLLAAARPVAGQQKPDFSGQWTLNKEKSRLSAAWTSGIERGVVRIEHRDPNFIFTRTFTIKGKDSQVSYAQTIDERVTEKMDGAVTVSSRMYWEGDVLVLSQRYQKPGSPDGTNVVHYRLLEGGRVLEAVERVTGAGAYENVWIFDKNEP